MNIHLTKKGGADLSDIEGWEAMTQAERQWWTDGARAQHMTGYHLYQEANQRAATITAELQQQISARQHQ